MLTRRRLLLRSAQAGAALWVGRLGVPPLDALARPAGAGTGELWTFGGELQYFRSDPAHLEQRLARCAQAGYTTIQTYVPWNVHESQRGRIDFSGQTSPMIVNDHVDQYQIEQPQDQVANGGAQAQLVANTDLSGYLQTLARHGFRVILRPGPFISDEWRNGGIPDWLLDAGFPDMYMRGPDGTPLTPGAPLATPPVAGVAGGGPLFYFPGPSYASDFYLGEAGRWLRAFAAFAKPWLATSGGPVVAVQVDDESCFYYRFGPFEADYHPAMLARYRAETGQAPPTSYPEPGGPVGELRAAFEWQSFKARQIGTFLGALATELRQAGIDVPIYHELELQLTPPAALAATAAGVDILHPEFYNGDSGPWSLPLNELDAGAVRAAQRQRVPVIAAEMQLGDALLYTLLLGEGLAGGLQFTYTDGVPDSAFDELARLGKTIRAAGDRLARTQRRADTAIVWCPTLLYAPYESQQYGFERDVRRVAERDVPALATMLIRAGLAFDLLDTDVARAEDFSRYPTVFLVASDVLPRSAQANLIAYVESGGRLVCWPSPPTLDEQLEPCELLAERLFPEKRATFYPDDPQQIRALGASVPVFRGVQTYALSPGARPFAFRGDEVCGYRRRAGRGEAWLLGAWPAADPVPGRAGVVLEVQQVSSSNAAAAAIGEQLGAPAAGDPRYLIAYDYSNERRGGEVVTGGAVAYWDGSDVVPIVEVNSAQQPASPLPQPYGAGVSTPPFRPLVDAHLTLARRLYGYAPASRTSDPRAQVRVLDASTQGGATVTALNRFPDDIPATVIETEVGGRRVRLPERGALKLPAHSGLVMPIDYTLARDVCIDQATAQLLGYRVQAGSLELELFSPAGGEIVVSLPGVVTAASIGDSPVPVDQARERRTGVRARIVLPAGEQTLRLSWHTRG